MKTTQVIQIIRAEGFCIVKYSSVNIVFDECIELLYSIFIVNNQDWSLYFIAGMSFQWLLGRYWDYKIFL